MVLTALLLQLAASVHVDPDEICRRFEAFDHNQDGQVEIARLRTLEFDCGQATTERARPRVLILVEERLLRPLANGLDLHVSLARLRDDLASEGYEAQALAVDLAPAEIHQDGRHLLALREVLRAFDADHRLEGALLVGHFPDAYLVRTCNWRRQGDITLRKGRPDEVLHRNVHYLRRVPEHVSQRADIVLADLDGTWEDVYVQPRTRLGHSLAVFGGSIPAEGGPCIDVEQGVAEFEDYFHLSDGKLEVAELVETGAEAPRFQVFLHDRSGDHECTADDRLLSNAIARPDIHVSRIDAWGTAQNPRADLAGSSGEHLLDDRGRPQPVTFAEGTAMPHWRDQLWVPDPVLERRLLAEYFDRNHGFRTGSLGSAWRPSSIACDLGTGYSSVAGAATNWVAGDRELEDIQGKPTLGRFVEWMRYPAVLRTIRAHSNATTSVFARCDVPELEALAGGLPWCWSPEGNRLEPSLRAPCHDGHLDWFLMRTLWENGAVSPEPSFYLHTGCEAISPPNSRTRPFTDPGYGVRQGAEALLLFGKGLALVGRAKVFYDEPRGFAAALAQGATVGSAWATYFDIESRSTWAEAGGDIGRKRSYFWSVLGDWTLRLSMGEPRATSEQAKMPEPEPAAHVPPPRTVDTSSWESIDLADSQLFLPDDLDLAVAQDVPLYVHFQGGVSAARDNFARMERRGVLLASTLAGLSGAFSRPYEDPAVFQALLDSVEAVLTERAGRPVRCGPVVITFFSAGYGAVRELLKHPAHFDRIQALVSADSIYASVVGEAIRAPEAEQMVDFLRFAQAAARGEKSFVLVHGMYATPYASTGECADLILASVGGRRVPKARVNQGGFATASEAHVGNFHLYTFDVDEPYIHVECMRTIPELVRWHLP